MNETETETDQQPEEPAVSVYLLLGIIEFSCTSPFRGRTRTVPSYGPLGVIGLKRTQTLPISFKNILA